MIDDPTWEFVPTDGSVIEAKPLVPVKRKSAPVDTEVWNYQGSLDGAIKADMSQFGPRSFHSSVTLTVEGQKIHAGLHRRYGLKNFLGLKGSKYELVFDSKDPHQDVIRKHFGKKSVIAVKVKEDSDHTSVTITPVKKEKNFTLSFQREHPQKPI